MQPIDYLLVAILVVIIGGAILYIVRAKKRGVKCIGCSASSCSCGDNPAKSCNCDCGCGCTDTAK